MSTSTQDSKAEKAKEAAAQAASSAQEVGDHATQAGKEVAQTAIEGAQDVLGDVREQGGQLVQEATQQLHGLASEATTQLRDHATTQTERAATQLKQLSQQARAFAEGRTEEAGALPQYAQQATEKLSSIAQRLDTGGVDGALADVRTFARRKPGTFLLLAGAAGFAAGRVLRGATAPQPKPPVQATPGAPALYLDEPATSVS